MNTTIAIEPFDATILVNIDAKKQVRRPCRVVGVTETSIGHQLVVLRHDDDGSIWAEAVSEVSAVD
jgi:hypothetical protein